MTNRIPKVIFIVENLDSGSVETWLLRMMAHAKELGFEINWTFYCILNKPGIKDEFAQNLGAKIVHSPVPISSKISFIRALRAELRYGKYDVLHSHHDLISGLYFLSSIGLPISRKLVHVHNTDESVLTDNPIKKPLFRAILRGLCLTLATKVIGNSNHSLDKFLAYQRRKKGRDKVHYLGVTPNKFNDIDIKQLTIHGELNLSPNTPILLFVGRVAPIKNPIFVVDVLGALRARVPEAVAIFVGTGALTEAVRLRADELGQTQHIYLLGWRDDVPAIMRESTWFILPHPEKPVEAFGFTVVEAQLAGTRMLLSKGVLDDPLLPTACYRQLSLSQSADEWANAAIELLNEPKPSLIDAITSLQNSPMDMDYALKDLMQLHQ